MRMRRGDPQNQTLTSSSWELSRLYSICRKKPFFVSLFKFIVCYLFFVLFLGEIDYKERIRKPYRSCSLCFSTMFLILDENKHGCSNVLSVTLCFEQNRHRMGDKSSVSAFGTYSVPAGWLTETGN